MWWNSTEVIDRRYQEYIRATSVCTISRNDYLWSICFTQVNTKWLWKVKSYAVTMEVLGNTFLRLKNFFDKLIIHNWTLAFMLARPWGLYKWRLTTLVKSCRQIYKWVNEKTTFISNMQSYSKQPYFPIIHRLTFSGLSVALIPVIKCHSSVKGRNTRCEKKILQSHLLYWTGNYRGLQNLEKENDFLSFTLICI